MSNPKLNLSGRQHTDSILRLRETKLPFRVRELLESVFFHCPDYQGKGDVWWQLIDLLEDIIVVSKEGKQDE